ncbi:hypothetical protein HK102_001779 [Quaeritorhiza haematococci]|nr:hypothetical protein HK102_001779 [Quaeritorhiza haematococci]
MPVTTVATFDETVQSVLDICKTADGTLIVSDTNGNCLKSIDAVGNVVGTWASFAAITIPFGIASYGNAVFVRCCIDGTHGRLKLVNPNNAQVKFMSRWRDQQEASGILDTTLKNKPEYYDKVRPAPFADILDWFKRFPDYLESMNKARYLRLNPKKRNQSEIRPTTAGLEGTASYLTVEGIRLGADNLHKLVSFLRTEMTIPLEEVEKIAMPAIATMFVEHTFSTQRVRGSDAARDLQDYTSLRPQIIEEQLRLTTRTIGFTPPERLHNKEFYQPPVISNISLYELRSLWSKFARAWNRLALRRQKAKTAPNGLRDEV